MMERAIRLARRGQGRVEPNPMAGCVIVRDGRVLGEGYHRRFGGVHAEVEALKACSGRARQATAYVSLEPCCHHGKTPPCTEDLIRAGISRVVIAVKDPNPVVSGRGIAALKSAGMQVEVGVLAAEAAELIAPFATFVRLHRPYVIAKWAQSLDGRLVDPSGARRWISNEASRRHAHRIRSRVDAILVGSGTVLADDPLLTARGVPLRRRALRVVLDGGLRISEKCRLVVTSQKVPTLVMTSREKARSPKAGRLRARGVEVAVCAARKRRLSLIACLKELAGRNVTSLMVEGGPTVLNAFLSAGLVDEALVYTAPILLDGNTRRGHTSGRIAGPHPRLSARTCRIRHFGTDTLHQLRLTVPPVDLPESITPL